MPQSLTAYDAQDAGIAQPIIYPIGVDDSIGGIDAGAGISFTYGIAGIGFLSAATDDNPYQRGLAAVLKEQVNNSEQPGDLSFTSWWYRSQTDWSKGAGTDYMEPITDSKVQSSFASSFGVDVWDQGELKLLPSTSQKGTFTSTLTTTVGEALTIDQAAYSAWGDQRTYVATGQDVKFYLQLGNTQEVSVLQSSDLGASEFITGLAYGHGFVWVSTNQSVWMLEGVPFSGSATFPGAIGVGTPAKAFSFPSTSVNTNVFFAKDRLILAMDGYVWDEGPPSTSPSTTALATSDALYNAGSATSWVAAAETPNSVLLAANSDTGSTIYSVSLDTTGALPVLAGPTVVAQFAPNEQVNQMSTYLGTYAIFGTSLGVRIGTISNSGITYGPLLSAPPPTGKFAMFSRFAFAPVADAGADRSGCIRIDLSELDSTGRAAWANDRRVPTGGLSATGVSVDKTGKVFLVGKASSGTGDAIALYQDDATFESVGFLETGTIRYGTTEKKYYDQVNIQLAPTWDGAVTVTSLDDDGNEGLAGSVTNVSGSDIDLTIDPVDPSSTLRLGFTLTPNSDSSKSPVVYSWQLRALPSVTRQRLIKVSLLNHDFERDHRGVNYGYEGYAIARFKSLEESSREGWPFSFQDLYTNETFRVVLENLSFTQTSPPSHASGFGGVIDLTVRVI